MKATTPEKITGEVLDLCTFVEPTAAPIYVDVRPVPNATLDDCLLNVFEQVTTHGGAERQGWAIWYIPGVWVEAEYHCIWLSPDGRLIDITPKKDGETSILFLPTERAPCVPGDFLPDSIRRPLKNTKDTRLNSLIASATYALRKKKYLQGLPVRVTARELNQIQADALRQVLGLRT